jgi:hypothetical protein
MRDKSHAEQIDRWAEYVINNPGKWKAKLKPFIDSQILMAQRFYKNLEKTEEGKEILKRIINDKINGKANVLVKT